MSTPKVVTFLAYFRHPSPSVLIPALRTVGNIVTGDDMQTQLELLSFFLIELSLVEHEMLKFPPSLLAASAIYTAQCTIYGFKEWNRTCEWHSNYSEEQLLESSRLMVGLH
ncbi:hypothetical protein OIU76_024756 [Salix suchowensis]|nr:hypothetical protein OIU76_024756 [Salix suchowensis]